MLEAFYVFIFNKIDRVLYAQATLELSLLKSQANGIMSSFMASYKWHIQWCGKHYQIEYISLLTVWLLRLLALINCFLKSYGWTDWHTPLSTLEVEAGELGVLDHPQLHSKLEAWLSYQRPCLKNQKSEQSKTKPPSNQILHRSLLAELSVLCIAIGCMDSVYLERASHFFLFFYFHWQNAIGFTTSILRVSRSSRPHL